MKEHGNRTKEDYVDIGFMRFLGKLLSFGSGTVVRIVDDDLTSRVEEVPHELLAPAHDLGPQRDSLRALLAYCSP